VSTVWKLVSFSVAIEFPEAGSFRMESSRGQLASSCYRCW